MGLSHIASKIDGNIGRVKSDHGAVATVAELLELLSSNDLDYVVPASEYETLKDELILVQTAVGLGDGSTVGSLEARIQALGLSAAHAIDNTIAVTTAEGTVWISNSADATDLLTLSRTFAGGGASIAITHGASATGLAIDVAMPGTSWPAMKVRATGSDDEARFGAGGILFSGSTTFSIAGDAPSTLGQAGRAMQIEAGRGGAGDGVTPPGAGADLDLLGGTAGFESLAGSANGGSVRVLTGAPSGSEATSGEPGNVYIGALYSTTSFTPAADKGNVVIFTGQTAVPGTFIGGSVIIGADNEVSIYGNVQSELAGPIAMLTGDQAALGAVVIEATNAAGSIRCNVAGTETLRVKSGQVLGPQGTSTVPGFGFIGDETNGFRRAAADAIGVVMGGIEYVQIRWNGIVAMNAAGVALSSSVGNAVLGLHGSTQSAAQAAINITNGGISLSGSSGTQRLVGLSATLNQTSTAAFTALDIDITETAIGSGAQKLIDARIGGTTKFQVGRTGVAMANELQSVQYVEKTADENVISSTTLQDDDHLTVSLEASAKYHFRLHLFINNVAATAAFKCTMNGSVGVSAFKAQVFYYSSTAMNTGVRITSLGSVAFSTLGSGNAIAVIEGTIETSTAGTFTLQWAQGTSDANNTTVQRNSSMVVHRCKN